MKKVRFNEDANEAYTLFTWKYAHQAARRGFWEEAARDRMRFKRRIQEVGTYINPILDVVHRNSIYEKIKHIK